MTDSRCIITNEWHSINKNVGAINDRGIVFDFIIIGKVHAKGWRVEGLDKVVYGFIGIHLQLIHRPSMRMYVNAAAMKAAGLD